MAPKSKNTLKDCHLRGLWRQEELVSGRMEGQVRQIGSRRGQMCAHGTLMQLRKNNTCCSWEQSPKWNSAPWIKHPARLKQLLSCPQPPSLLLGTCYIVKDPGQMTQQDKNFKQTSQRIIRCIWVQDPNRLCGLHLHEAGSASPSHRGYQPTGQSRFLS